MFDFVRKHTRILFFALLLIVLPSFLLVGHLDRLMGRNPALQEVASVGGQAIIQAELDDAVQQVLDRQRRQNPDKDIKELDTPQLRGEVLDDLVRRRVMQSAVREFHVEVTDEQLKRVFATDPQFATLRNPDGTVNKAILESQGLKSDTFAEMLRKSMALQRLSAGLDTGAFVPPALTQQAIEAFFQQREIQVQFFNPSVYASQVSPTDAQLEAFYQQPATAARFLQAEQADVEYVTLSPGALSRQVQVSDDEIKAAYDQGLKSTPPRFTKPEARRASHILIKPGAKEQDRVKAKAKAEALLEALRKNPASFAELAKQNSDDAGSSASGGDLDFLTRDDIIKPFSEALFALKLGAISEVIESEQGFHIILMTGLRPGEIQPLESVKSDLMAELQQSQARKKFADAVLDFGNMVFEQSDTFKNIAEKWKLEVRTAKHLKPAGAASQDPVLAHPKVLQAVFSPESVRDQRNTPAIEISPEQFVSLRVLSHTAPRQPPLSEVQAQVRQAYVDRESAALARQEGEKQAAIAKEKPPATLSQPIELVSRAGSGNFPLAYLEKVMRAPVGTLPVTVGIDMADKGYALVLITRVIGPDPVVRADPEALRMGFAQLVQEAEKRAYDEALKKRFKVSIKTLEP
ncbi:MAG: SurA N-terminal domain-containing protein [Burkholderiales bacterium]